MKKTYAQLLAEHPQFKFEPGMLVLFHTSLKDTQKMRLRNSENARLWKVADDALEPVLDDYGTAAALLEALSKLLGDYGYEIHYRPSSEKSWVIKIRVHNLFEEGFNLGEVLAIVLLRIWDEKKLNVSKVF